MQRDPRREPFPVMRFYREHSREICHHDVELLVTEACFRQPCGGRFVVAQFQFAEESCSELLHLHCVRSDSEPCRFLPRQVGKEYLLFDNPVVSPSPSEDIYIRVACRHFLSRAFTRDTSRYNTYHQDL